MKKFIKPARPDLLVRDHADKLRAVPSEGKAVLWDGYWARKERAGDIIVVDQAAKPVAATSSSRKSEKSAPKTGAQKPIKTED